MTFITTSSETGDNNFTLSYDQQQVVVARDVTLVSDYGKAITSDYDASNIYNFGSLFGGYICISLNVGGAVNGRVVNGASGTLQGQVGISAAGQSQAITNDGSIEADGYGIEIGGSAGTVFNAGTIHAGSVGVALGGTDGHLMNAGTILSEDKGILIYETSASTITNQGTIRGVADAVLQTDVGSVTLTNRGTLDGAVTLGGGADRVRNAGRILGTVDLGDGANRFDGRGGTVEGAILGGAGVDAATLGADGETVQGGGGHDRLTGGAGADTFVFISAAAADWDVVSGFDAGNDTLALSHGAFRALATGRTPVFATGAKAVSAADHLFYNATSGGLYYDADGSGTKSAATLVARLDPGLHLTAQDFRVLAAPLS